LVFYLNENIGLDTTILLLYQNLISEKT